MSLLIRSQIIEYMNTPTQYYSISNTKEHYASEHSLPLIIIDTDKCYAVISLYGGQILSFKAKNKEPLLWLSENAVFKNGVAIRGGIPICAPWFGEHSEYALNHGFARISEWDLAEINQLKNSDVVITLKLTENELSKQYDYQQFTMEINIILGSTLSINFSFENNRDISQTCEWAMHSYFQVDDCKTTTVDGLLNYTYQDKTKNNKAVLLTKPQVFEGEIDRSFVNASTVQKINNISPITITGQNCNSVIVWNPGEILANKMSDIIHSNKFVCVERGAINELSWNVFKDEKETASMTITN